MKRLTIVIAAAIFMCSAAFAQSPKFAHVNFSELVQLMPEMDSARVQLETTQMEIQETYQSMINEFQTKYAQFNEKQATWTASVKASKERELSEIQTRIQEFEQTSQQELQQVQNALMAPIYQKAQDTVQKLAKTQGFIFVFDASQLLYIDEAQSANITQDARKALGIPDDRTLESLQAELQAKAQAAAGAQQ